MKENKKILILIIMVFVFVTLGFITYQFCYNKVGQSNKKSEGISNLKKEYETLNTNSSLVQKLYGYLKESNQCNNKIISDQEQEIYASDLDYTTKFQLAIGIMTNSDKVSINCNQYNPSKYLNSNELDDTLQCGDSFYNPITKKFENDDNSESKTTLLKEDSIKRGMNQIFGENTYQKKDKIINEDMIYKYIQEENGYITLSMLVDCAYINYQKKLVSAFQSSDAILLNEKVTFNSGISSNIYNYSYLFKKDTTSGNYYFTSLKSTKEKE